MILAAGLGTRLLPLTQYLPKPLFPILNQPLLERLCLNLTRQGFEYIFINTFHLSQAIIDWYSGFHARTNIHAVVEVEHELLGTGGGIGNMFRRHCDRSEPLLVINADVVTDVDLAALYRLHVDGLREEPSLIASLLLHRRDPWNKVEVRQGFVKSFGYSAPDAFAFTGISVLSPSFLDSIPQGPGSVITALESAGKKGGRIGAVMCQTVSSNDDGSWIWEDTGTPEGYLRAHQVLLEQSFRETNLHNDCLVASKAALESGVVCRHWSCIGSRAVVGRNVVLDRSVVWPDTRVAEEGVYKNAIITPYGVMNA